MMKKSICSLNHNDVYMKKNYIAQITFEFRPNKCCASPVNIYL